MADKEFGGCNIDPEGEARERQSTREKLSTSPLPISSEVEKVRKAIVEEGRGIF